jgi:hypothetical protein
LVVYFLFVEVKDASLEEAAAILDGVEMKEKITEGVARATGMEAKYVANDDKTIGGTTTEILKV